jgi:Uma2 family endonuclease
MTLTTDLSSLPLRRFNPEEYQRLVEGGIFAENEPVEFVEGLIWLKNTPRELRRFNVSEYHQMASIGIFAETENIELIEGQIIKKMSPQGTPHASAIRRLTRLLENLDADACIQIQLPIQLNDRSEPEPDIAVVAGDVERYDDHHPIPSEIYLIIEVADTTLKTDCEIKALSYAKSGIADYWVLDVTSRQLYIFRDPTSQGYQAQTILPETQTISPLNFPDSLFLISQILQKKDMLGDKK